MIARGVTRERESQSRRPLERRGLLCFGEHLLESIILSPICGAVLGVIVALSMPLLQRLVPDTLAAWAHPEIDNRRSRSHR